MARNSSRDYLFAALQRCLPTLVLSRLIFAISHLRASAVKSALIHSFCRLYSVDLTEASVTRVDDYPTFNAFFTRSLKVGARSLPHDQSILVSPVDGIVSQCAPIEHGRIIQAKGRDYSALELLGGDTALADKFNAGSFCTIYLAPRNYHRIHMPLDGLLIAWSYIPGRLLSVNPSMVDSVPRLFARNERLVAVFDTRFGVLALVMVGALFVGSLETVWAGRVSPPHGRRNRISQHHMFRPLPYARGAELGRFNMGSTIILLAEERKVQWLSANVSSGTALQMGQPLAECEKQVPDSE